MTHSLRTIDNSLRKPIQQSANSDQLEPWIDFSEPKSFTAPIPALEVKGDLATYVYDCVRLDWEDLQCFEAVNYQFKHWGVVFANAIALRPSNAAYPPYSGDMVVMGAPRNGWLEAKFLRPVQFVSGFVTSTRRTILTAFDHNNVLLGQMETPGANLANSHAIHSANMRLSLTTARIHRVTFHTFNGHLTLDDFCFSF